jgi:hypothetical protein
LRGRHGRGAYSPQRLSVSYSQKICIIPSELQQQRGLDSSRSRYRARPEQQPRCCRRRLVADVSARLRKVRCGVQIDIQLFGAGFGLLSPENHPSVFTLAVALVFNVEPATHICTSVTKRVSAHRFCYSRLCCRSCDDRPHQDPRPRGMTPV